MDFQPAVGRAVQCCLDDESRGCLHFYCLLLFPRKRYGWPSRYRAPPWPRNRLEQRVHQQQSQQRKSMHGSGKARRRGFSRCFGFTMAARIVCALPTPRASSLEKRDSAAHVQTAIRGPSVGGEAEKKCKSCNVQRPATERHEATSDLQRVYSAQMLKLNNSPSLDPLHSPLSAQDAGPTLPQNQATPDPMAKTKRRMFSTPLLRRSATASSAAAASAASMIKSNLSTVTKLPTALKRASANSGSAVDDHKATVDRAPTIPSLSRSSTDSSVKQEEAKAAPHQNGNRMFGIPSLMRIRTSSKDKTHSKPLPVSTASDCPLDSPEHLDHSSRGNNSENEAENEQKSAANTASRFVMGVPAMLRRAVSNNHTPPTAAVPQKKSPDTSPNSTPRGEFPEDDLENDRHSLLMMLQVPEERRSQIPLMAAREAW